MNNGNITVAETLSELEKHLREQVAHYRGAVALCGYQAPDCMSCGNNREYADKLERWADAVGAIQR